jgi:hypothetical protein
MIALAASREALEGVLDCILCDLVGYDQVIVERREY